MRSMTFLVNDRSTGSGPTPAVAVTVAENSDGSLSFAIQVVGAVTGDLRGFFFDVANESRIGTLSVTPTSQGFTEFRQGNDSIRDLGNGANMNGLLGSDGGYDAGIEIGGPGAGHGDDYHGFSFTLRSSAGPLTLDDFANVDFGVRLGSVSLGGDGKLLEHTTSAIDAKDDTGAVTEDAAVNQVTGNVFDNDLNLQPVHLITAVNGSASNIGDPIQGTYGTLRLNLNGSYTYTLDNSRAATQALAAGQQVVESFTYTAKSFDELTSASSDTASILITITGAADNANAAPVITAAVAAGSVTEIADHAPGESVQPHVASGTVDFTDANLTDTHSISVAAAGAGYLGSFNAAINNPATGDGVGQVTWTFEVLDSMIEHLGAGEQLTQSYLLTLDDGHGGTASQPVTITIAGANDAPVAIAQTKGGEVTEDAATEASGFIAFTDLDLSDSHTVSVTPAAAGYLGALSAAVTDPSTGDGTGQVDWTFSVPNAALQFLGEGESIGQSYQISIDDGHGGVLTQQKLAITLNGANDAPDIVGGHTSGQVFEDGSRRAEGQLLARDADHNATLSWSLGNSAPSQTGAFGTLSVDSSSGFWLYRLDNALPAVQTLAQGDHVTDTFTVKVTDEHGAFDTQTVSIDVVGSNDQPQTGASSTTFANLVEDFGPSSGGGQVIATDADHGTVLQWSVAPTVRVPTGPSTFQFFGYQSDYHFTVDELSITKNGTQVFVDTFRDGVPPPSVPGTGFATNYLGGGGFTESGDRLHLDGSTLAAVSRGIDNPDLVAGFFTLLNSNIDPADTTNGLKSGDDFTVEARFDLAQTGIGQGYGVTLIDNTSTSTTTPPSQLGDSNAALVVRRLDDGRLVVQLYDFNTVTDHRTPGQELDLSPQAGENQIVLRLVHDTDQGGLVHGEVDLLGGVDGTRTLRFDAPAHIFGSATPDYPGDDEDFTRVQLIAFGPDNNADTTSLNGKYGTLNVQQNGQWNYTLDPVASQAAAQGSANQEFFAVRATDDYGLSAFRVVVINVSGNNDPVVLTGGVLQGDVTEDTNPFAAGNVSFTDPDLTDTHTASFTFSTTAPVFAPLGTFHLLPASESPITPDGSIGWTYELSDAAQYLASGETVTESYTVTVQDPFSFGFGPQQTVTITIHGTDETGTGPIALPSLYFTLEDVVQLNGFAQATGGSGPLAFSLASAAQHGSAVLLADGTFRYTPVEDFSGVDSFDFSVTDSQGGQDTGSITIQVQAVPDAPTVSAPANLLTGLNEAVPLEIFAALNDTDGSESLEVSISGVFSGSLSAGTNIGAGIWHLAPEQLPGLMFIPALNSTAGVTLGVQALSKESSTGEQASAFTTIAIGIEAGDAFEVRPDTNLGNPVIEQGTGPSNPFAGGNVLNNDANPDPFSPLHVTAVNGSAGLVPMVTGTYGNLSLQFDGNWTYFLNDGDPDTNALVQNEHVSDVFTYTATDNHGASATTTLTIDITGANDFPVFGPGSSLIGDVTKGGNPVASGQLAGLDPDHGAQLHSYVTNATGGAGNYLFAIDEFTLVRLRPGIDTAPITILNDTFSDNAAPPISPPFSNGVAQGYVVRGAFTESGGVPAGHAFMNGALAQTTFNYGAPAIMVTNSALALTNISTDLTQGLRITGDFEASGRFDAVAPVHIGDAYGVAFSDQNIGFGGDDNIQLLVRRDEDGAVRVVLREADGVSNSITIIESFDLGPLAADDDIVLRLAHDHNQAGMVAGSFNVVHADGSGGDSHTFANKGQIFGTETPSVTGDDEAFTRAMFLATGPATTTTRTGTYGTLAVDHATGAWVYGLDANDPDTLALAPSATGVETFQVVVADQFNFGSLGTLNVLVHGSSAPGSGGPGITISGTPAADTLAGTSGDDTLVGNGGNDILFGLAGADTFDFNSLADGTDTIRDFNLAQGDKLDLHDLLRTLPGFVEGVTDPSDLITFVNATGAIAGTNVMVGAASAPVPVPGFGNVVAVLEGVTGLNVDDLIANGSLIV